MNDGNRRVWSSDGGRVPDAKPRESSPAGDGIARVSRETKGRRGKTVTVIQGLDLAPTDLAELAGELKKRCGVGGSAKDGVITIQGDKVDEVMGVLEQRGVTVRRSGG